MRIRVIGGGWYGCHIAHTLIQAGHDVTVFERGADLFNEASGANQSRLHLGFHYPRCAKTRQSCIVAAERFMSTYPEITHGVRTNIYAVCEEKSLVDWGTYRDTMASSGVEFLTVDPEDYGLVNLEGAMLTGERLILGNHARDMFRRLLDGHVELGVEAQPDDGDFDVTVNATYAAIDTGGVGRYEPVVIPLFEGRCDMAVTVMDGPMGASIYPWMSDGLVSLTSVRDVRVAEVETYEEARRIEGSLNGADLKRIGHAMTDVIRGYVPWFLDEWKPAGFATTIRALPGHMSDRRICHIHRDASTIHVLPGKISNVFDAADEVASLI